MKIELILEDESLIEIETELLPVVGQTHETKGGKTYSIDFREVENPTNPIPRFQACELDPI
ncbi:MAG: hypothetical protein HOH33_00985 [Verrucomicrobia bacterium]|jgi:hypothetical protein|nr:hypothetical protein [Verrucomicrobiota bacterium]